MTAPQSVAGARFAVVRSPGTYIQRVVEAPRPGVTLDERMPQLDGVETPDAATDRADAAMLALRLNRGLDVEAFRERFGLTPDEAFDGVLDDCAALGLVEREGSRIRLTARGRLLSNEVFVRLIAARERSGAAVETV